MDDGGFQRFHSAFPEYPDFTNLSSPAAALCDSGKYWLVVGIPTVPRRNDTDYLSRTLSSLLEELPLDPTDVLYARVRVIVMNNRPGNHTTWSRVCFHTA